MSNVKWIKEKYPQGQFFEDLHVSVVFLITVFMKTKVSLRVRCHTAEPMMTWHDSNFAAMFE